MPDTATGQTETRSATGNREPNRIERDVDVDKTRTSCMPTRTISGTIPGRIVCVMIHGEPVKNTDALANPEALVLYRDRLELTS